MKALFRRILGSRESIYLTALAAALFVIFAGWFIIIFNAAGIALIFFGLAALGMSLSWISFVLYSTTIVNRQISTSVTQVMSKQTRKIEQALHKNLEELSERQLKEYRAQALNSLIKLEQLRVTPRADAKGSHDD